MEVSLFGAPAWDEAGDKAAGRRAVLEGFRASAGAPCARSNSAARPPSRGPPALRLPPAFPRRQLPLTAGPSCPAEASAAGQDGRQRGGAPPAGAGGAKQRAGQRQRRPPPSTHAPVVSQLRPPINTLPSCLAMACGEGCRAHAPRAGAAAAPRAGRRGGLPLLRTSSLRPAVAVQVQPAGGRGQGGSAGREPVGGRWGGGRWRRPPALPHVSRSGQARGRRGTRQLGLVHPLAPFWGRGSAQPTPQSREPQPRAACGAQAGRPPLPTSGQSKRVPAAPAADPSGVPRPPPKRAHNVLTSPHTSCGA